MILDEETYDFIHEIIDGVYTTSKNLTKHIGSAKEKLVAYHYDVFNRFIRTVIESYVDNISFLVDEYGTTRETIKCIIDDMGCGDLARIRMSNMLDLCADQLVEALKQSKALQNDSEYTETSNPNIPDPQNEVYKVFAGYRNKVDRRIEADSQKNENVIIDCMVQFGRMSKDHFVQLFNEYDLLINGLGDNIQDEKKAMLNAERTRDLVNTTEFTKSRDKGLNEGLSVADAIRDLGLVGIGFALGKKSGWDIAKKAIMLTKTVFDQTVDDDKSKASDNKDSKEGDNEKAGLKSIARKALKGVSLYGDAISLAEGLLDTVDPSDSLDIDKSACVMIFGAVIALGGKGKLEDLKKSKKLDVYISGIGLASKATKFVGGIITGQAVLVGLKQCVGIAKGGINLATKVSKNMECTHSRTCPKVRNALYRFNNDIKTYNSEMQIYKAKKMQGALAARKPRGPNWVKAVNALNIANRLIKEGDYLVKSIGSV